MSKQLGENMFRDNLDDYEARKDASKQQHTLDGQWHSPSVVTTGNLDHLKMPEAPAPVDAGLIERMLDAARVDKDDWRSYCSDDRSLFIKAMTAALRVAADALLGPVTDAEWSGASSYRKEQALYLAGMAGVNGLLETRRARLLAPVKSVEERVTVEFVSACDEFGWKVFADHDERGLFKSEQDAQIYRLGLIASLKEPKP